MAQRPVVSLRVMQSFGMAIGIEVALIAAIVALITHFAAPAVMPEPVPILMLSQDKAPPAPLPSPPKPVQPVPAPPVPKQVRLPPVMAPVTPRVAAVPLPVAPREPVAAVPNAMTTPASPPAAPAPPTAPASVGADVLDAYAARVHTAVQAAHYYPPAAAALHFTGRVRVEFHLQDAVISRVQLVQGSGIGIIDRAALQTVQSAQYPVPPAALQGSDHAYQVWVEFAR